MGNSHRASIWSILVALLPAALIALGGAVAQPLTVPPGAHPVSGSFTTSLREEVNVLAGDRRDLIYTSYRRNDAGGKNFGSERAYVLERSGKRISLGRV